MIKALIFSLGISLVAYGQSNITNQQVRIEVDANAVVGTFSPQWAFFGYDEPNYTYMRDGRKLLSEISALSPAPVEVRVHNLLTTGNGEAALKWGSTNAYTEDAQGNAHYDWTIVDRIFDTFTERKMKPLVEIGFMPEALSTHPEPYRHHWNPAQPYQSIYTGWAYPPRDYQKWAELIYQWVKHCESRYGKQQVATWHWEVWNEPNIEYWKGSPEEYFKLYDYAADAVKRALPEIRIGGPTSTGPGDEKAAAFLRAFLEHVVNGTNYATGKRGAPLDYISFHAKGRPKIVDGHVQMGSEFQLRDVDRGFAIVESFPQLRSLPIILGESDPEGCAACSVQYNPQNDYRNGTLYPTYLAAIYSRIRELAAKHHVNFEGAVTWAFEFEDQPWFAGFRDLATNGIDKPSLNVVRMFGLMNPQEIRVTSSGAIPLDSFIAQGAKQNPDINALATRGSHEVSVLLWNYSDENTPAPDAPISVLVRNLPSNGRMLVRHFRIDQSHSNAYNVWKSIGSPQKPSSEQYEELERAGQLQLLSSPQWVDTHDGQLTLQFALPRQAVSLVQLSWE